MPGAFTSTRERYPRVAELPFDTAYKLMATFHRMDDEGGTPVIRCFVKGAPDQLLARASQHLNPALRGARVDDEFTQRYLDENERLASQGLRVMATARKDFEPADMAGFIDYVKANAGNLTLANAGIGAVSQLCGMLLMHSLDAQLTTVPYKGTGPAMTDLLGGQVDILCDQTTNTTQQVQAGTIKAYAVTTPERLEVFPDLPTAVESGLPDMELSVWHGVYTPKGTPAEINERLAKALQVALADEGVVKQLAELGSAPVPAEKVTPAALKTKLETEIARWKPIIEAAGVYAD